MTLSSDNTDELELLLLETLSFYEPMTRAQILMQLDEKRIEELSHYTFGDLEQMLKDLTKKGTLKECSLGLDRAWQRVFKRRRTWWRRLFCFMNRTNVV